MRVLSFAVAAAILACLIAIPRAAEAQAVPLPPAATTTKVFVTIDAVALDALMLEVTGVVQGESTPSTWRTALSSSGTTDVSARAEWLSMCHRSALVAMARPGQYLLEIFYADYDRCRCKLIRVNP